MASTTPQLKNFYLLLGVVALAGGGYLAWQAFGSHAPPSVPVNVAIAPSDTAGFGGYFLGSDTAPVTVTEYADYQCPACGQLEILQFPTIKRQLVETGKVRWRYRDYPLDQLHGYARLAAHAAACADEQGKFWPMHDTIYANQAEWSARGASRFRGYAESVGLDLGQYDACMSSVKFAGRIQASVDEGTRLGVTGTPTLVIGGRAYGYLASDQLKAIVDSIIAGLNP